MSEVLLYRLKMNREVILRDIEPELVLDYLYQEDVLDCDSYEEVRDKGPRKKQAALLLSYVEGESSAIEKMIVALQKSQRHLAKILQEPLENEVNLSKGISKSFHNTLDKPENCYPMTHVPCGYAVIINNYDFGTEDDFRKGSEVDVQHMTNLFKYLQFTVVVHENKTAAEIKHIVRDYSIKEDHNHFDCFVLFLMSHGYSNGIFGTDWGKVDIQLITRGFQADKCYSLANKPKLIFVQACRGTVADKGFVLTDSPLLPTGTTPSQEQNSSPNVPKQPPNSFDITPTENSLPEVNVQYIPTDADIFTAYASSTDHAALRNTSTGGWFVTKLYEVMLHWAKTEDLQSMMLRVAHHVSLKKTDQLMMQCPQIHANMRGKVFFKPKNTYV